MYIRKIDYVLSNHNIGSQGSCVKMPDNRYYRVNKIGRVLTLKEENAMRLTKDSDTAAIANQGFVYYQVISNTGACEQCQIHDGAIYPIAEAKERENLPPFHPNCECAIQGFATENPNQDPWKAEVLLWLDIMYGDSSIRQKAQKVIDFYKITEPSQQFIKRVLSVIRDIAHIARRIEAFFFLLEKVPDLIGTEMGLPADDVDYSIFRWEDYKGLTAYNPGAMQDMPIQTKMASGESM